MHQQNDLVFQKLTVIRNGSYHLDLLASGLLLAVVGPKPNGSVRLLVGVGTLAQLFESSNKSAHDLVI